MNGDLSMGNDGIISNAVVENNIIYNNGTMGGSGINMDGVTDSIIRNNLLYNNHAGGIAIYQIDAAVNNTIIMASDGRWAVNIADIGCINNKLFNNIIYTYHSWRGGIVIPSPLLPGFESDYNATIDRFSADGDSSVISLSEWQLYGFDIHTIISDPVTLFNDPLSDDYHLKELSPAIDTGLWLIDVPTDLEGISRPQGIAFDRGAYEYHTAILPSIGKSGKIIMFLILGILIYIHLKFFFIKK